MNTTEKNLTLDPYASSDYISPEINPVNDISIQPMGDIADSNDMNLNIKNPTEQIIESSVQINPKPQEMVNKNSIRSENDPMEQTSQANANANRNSFSDARFNNSNEIGGNSVGSSNRVSSETKKPSPMAASRAMDTRLSLANKSKPAWRQAYI